MKIRRRVWTDRYVSKHYLPPSFGCGRQLVKYLLQVIKIFMYKLSNFKVFIFQVTSVSFPILPDSISIMKLFISIYFIHLCVKTWRSYMRIWDNTTGIFWTFVTESKGFVKTLFIWKIWQKFRVGTQGFLFRLKQQVQLIGSVQISPLIHQWFHIIHLIKLVFGKTVMKLCWDCLSINITWKNKSVKN